MRTSLMLCGAYVLYNK